MPKSTSASKINQITNFKWFPMLKNKNFKTIFCSAGNQCYQRKVVPQVNLVIPPVVSRLISVGELRAVAIKHLVELSVEHEFFCHFFSKRKTCHAISKKLEGYMASGTFVRACVHPSVRLLRFLMHSIT